MSTTIGRDPRVKQVPWRDLIHLTWWERVYEIVLVLPWLAASLLFYGLSGWWAIAAVVCSFFFFLCGLRVVHNAYHYAMGIGRIGCELVMCALSVLMMSAMHAIQVTHLHHHRHNLDEEDIEAYSAKMPGWKALLLGPLFTWNLHYHGYRLGKQRARWWIRLELVLIAAWVLFVFAAAPHLSAFLASALQWHVIAMAVGQCGTGFFAVWTVHHDCEMNGIYARTQTGWLKNVISYEMFHHLEHHLFPAVPTCHLPTLAERLDEVAPDLRQKTV
jgi:fatty acid desaturase